MLMKVMKVRRRLIDAGTGADERSWLAFGRCRVWRQRTSRGTWRQRNRRQFFQRRRPRSRNPRSPHSSSSSTATTHQGRQRAGCRRPRRRRRIHLRSIVRQVRANEVPSSKSAQQRQLPCHYRSSDDTSEPLRVVSWVCRVCASETEQVENSLLGSEDGATTDGSNFNGRHRHSHE